VGVCTHRKLSASLPLPTNRDTGAGNTTVANFLVCTERGKFEDFLQPARRSLKEHNETLWYDDPPEARN
jgi:hypothetical protein